MADDSHTDSSGTDSPDDEPAGRDLPPAVRALRPATFVARGSAGQQEPPPKTGGASGRPASAPIDAARAVAAVAVALPLAAVITACLAAAVWLFIHPLFPLTRAISCGLTFGGLAGVTYIALRVLPRGGLVRSNAAAVLAGLWAACVVGWLMAVWSNPDEDSIYSQNHWWLAFGVCAAVSTGGVGLIRVWRRRIPRPFSWLAGLGVAPAALALPVVACYFLWNTSAHFGTAGAPTAAQAAHTWVLDAFVLGSSTPDGEMSRVTCDDPQARHDLDAFLDSWHRFRVGNEWDLHPVWAVRKTSGHGDRATVSGSLSLSINRSNGTIYTVPPTTLTFQTVKSWDGWRVCGLSIPGWDPDQPTSTPDSAPQTPSPAPPPSATPTPTPVGPPTDMQKCGAHDPYRSMGWYTCPPRGG